MGVCVHVCANTNQGGFLHHGSVHMAAATRHVLSHRPTVHGHIAARRAVIAPRHKRVRLRDVHVDIRSRQCQRECVELSLQLAVQWRCFYKSTHQKTKKRENQTQTQTQTQTQAQTKTLTQTQTKTLT